MDPQVQRDRAYEVEQLHEPVGERLARGRDDRLVRVAPVLRAAGGGRGAVPLELLGPDAFRSIADPHPPDEDAWPSPAAGGVAREQVTRPGRRKHRDPDTGTDGTVDGSWAQRGRPGSDGRGIERLHAACGYHCPDNVGEDRQRSEHATRSSNDTPSASNWSW
jgi:hypothetical protein